ncbi:hypothetical protein ACLGI4_11180 [Streptomyces sp. HMX112]|uniref:hypothetical protein n=1 Tax=Streptomyces sp. HMX112 TaxID=3390850 RepID=UPI003A7F7068
MPTPKHDVPMRDLLASCAAASAVSTPPETAAAAEDHQDAQDSRHSEDAPGGHGASRPRDERPEAA